MILQAGNVSSPAQWVRWALQLMCGGNDPVVQIVENFGGDWEPVSRAGSAMESLSVALNDAAQYAGTAGA